MDWTQQWQSNLIKKWGGSVSPDRCSRHTGLAALPHRNIQQIHIFAENAWYFRNALVRANYTNLQKGIHETTEYLEVFLRNLLLNEKNELHNRNLHISGLLNEEKVDIGNVKVDRCFQTSF
mgnify:CR=1 FL=1